MSHNNSEARVDFEQEREKILSDLPSSIIDMFGQIGFMENEIIEDSEDEDANNNKDPNAPTTIITPVLIVSPYDVPPRPVRDVYWFDMYSKGKRTKSLAKLPYLIYHYGNPSTDPTDVYSFLEHDEFIIYEDGVAQGYDQIPPSILYKLQHNLPLKEEEDILVRGLNEMKEDLHKHPTERKRGITSFMERHEQSSSGGRQSTTTAAARPTASSSSKKTTSNTTAAGAATAKRTATKKDSSSVSKQSKKR